MFSFYCIFVEVKENIQVLLLLKFSTQIHFMFQIQLTSEFQDLKLLLKHMSNRISWDAPLFDYVSRARKSEHSLD